MSLSTCLVGVSGDRLIRDEVSIAFDRKAELTADRDPIFGADKTRGVPL